MKSASGVFIIEKDGVDDVQSVWEYSWTGLLQVVGYFRVYVEL